MIKELWNSFPRLMEEKINALLDEAEPSPAKAFQLYKTCQSEDLWSESFEKFNSLLRDFFALPKTQRRKSSLDQFLERPMNSSVFEDFHLNFRNAVVDRGSLLHLSSWAHNLIRVSKKTETVVISTDVLTRTLNYITAPPLFEKAEKIEFEDFLSGWQKIVFNLFGKKHDAEFTAIVSELRWMNTQLKEAEKNPRENAFYPTIYLTQTEIDWTMAVHQAVEQNTPVPKFPLSRGPQKQRLIDLERAISLYKIVQTTKLTDFIKHRENIRTTILDRCESILRERAS